MWLMVVWRVKMKAVLGRSEAFHVSGGVGHGEDSCVNFKGMMVLTEMVVLVAVIKVGSERAEEAPGWCLLKAVAEESG